MVNEDGEDVWGTQRLLLAAMPSVVLLTWEPVLAADTSPNRYIWLESKLQALG